MDVYHVSHRTVCEGRAKHGDIVLEVKKGEKKSTNCFSSSSTFKHNGDGCNCAIWPYINVCTIMAIHRQGRVF